MINTCYVQALKDTCRKKAAIFYRNPSKALSKETLGMQQPIMNFALQLQQSEKDKSENVMVVDLVRNDLSKSVKREP
jgi:para-aminobenzoate synthetase component 1